MTHQEGDRAKFQGLITDGFRINGPHVKSPFLKSAHFIEKFKLFLQTTFKPMVPLVLIHPCTQHGRRQMRQGVSGSPRFSYMILIKERSLKDAIFRSCFIFVAPPILEIFLPTPLDRNRIG